MGKRSILQKLQVGHKNASLSMQRTHSRFKFTELTTLSLHDLPVPPPSSPHLWSPSSQHLAVFWTGQAPSCFRALALLSLRSKTLTPSSASSLLKCHHIRQDFSYSPLQMATPPTSQHPSTSSAPSPSLCFSTALITNQQHTLVVHPPTGFNLDYLWHCRADRRHSYLFFLNYE